MKQIKINWDDFSRHGTIYNHPQWGHDMQGQGYKLIKEELKYLISLDVGVGEKGIWEKVEQYYTRKDENNIYILLTHGGAIRERTLEIFCLKNAYRVI